MTDTESLDLIKKMNVYELLEYILLNPTDLTDSYYREYAKAIETRFVQLQKELGD